MNLRPWIIRLFVLLFAATAVFTACAQEASSPPVTETQASVTPTAILTEAQDAASLPQPTPPVTVSDFETLQPPVPFETDKLAAMIDTRYDLEDYPPDAPIIIFFSKPINSTHNAPLLFTPAISGEFEWNETETAVRFTPNNHFTGGRSYQISVNASLRSQDDERFTGSNRWRVTMLTTPQVQRRTPHESTTATHKPTFRLQFNRPMNMQSVADALSMTPQIPYTLTWEEETLVIRLDEALTFGTTYQFTVADTAVDITDRQMMAPYTWDVQLKTLVNSFSSPTKTNHLAPVKLLFNYSIDLEKSTDFVSIHPAIGGAWTWNDDHTNLTFTPSHRFATDTTYELVFAGSVFTQSGYEIPVPKEPMAFVTPPTILDIAPADHAHPSLPIEIMFDRLMDQAVTETAVSIRPPIDGSFTWEETTLIFKPESGYFDAKTTYEVTIEITAVDADGEAVLREPYVWSFTTGEASNAADFGEGPNFQVVDVNGRRAVQFRAFISRPVLVGFELYQLPMDTFMTLYLENYNDNWWEQTDPIPTDDLTRIANWHMETNPATYEWQNVQETVIPANVPAGFYLLSIKTGQINDQLFVIFSENTISAKVADEQLVAWVTHINDQVKPNLPITVLAADGSIMASGITNELGVYRTTIPNDSEFAPAAERPFLVLAEDDGVFAITGLQNAWRSNSLWGWWGNPITPQNYAAYIYTDRPIYKPGQTVYFKAIIRQDDDAVLSMVPAGTAVSLTIRDTRNNLVQTIPGSTNSFGTVTGEFNLAEGAMLGNYNMVLTIDGEEHTQMFRVEEYRKPDYEVTVTTDQAKYVRGTIMEITVDTEYFFGEPVPFADVSIRRFQLIENYDYSGISGDYIWLRDYDPPMTGKTDENGRFTTNILAQNDAYYDNYWGSGPNHQGTIWGIEATVTDNSNQSVSSFTAVTVYNTSERLLVDHGSYAQEPGRPFTVRASVTDLFDNPVPNRTLTIELLRYSSSSGNYDRSVQTSRITTDEHGVAHTSYTIDDPGYYRLTVSGKDAGNRDIEYTSWIYAFSSGYSNWFGGSGGTVMTTDKTSYVPGETAVLLIESELSGPALLTFERGTIRRELLVTLTSPLTRVEVPILTTDSPNIFATLTAWQPQHLTINDDVYTSLPDSNLITTSVNISVPAAEKQLQVTITTDKETYTPGEAATFTVRVTNAAGVPVSAEVSMALVDDAIFALSDELSGPIYDGFYFERQNGIINYHSFAPQRYLGGGWGGGGGGGDGAANPRQDFEDTAVWLPTLHTNFNGEATITVTLPDNLTRWRMTAKAVTADTQVGETISTVTTHQPILIRPLLPRTLTAGDTLQLTGLLHNNTDQPQALAVALQEMGESPNLEILSPVTLTLMLEPGEIRAVGWTVSAANAGTSDIIMTAHHNAAHPSGLRLTDVADSVQLPLTIKPLAIPNVETTVGQFSSRYQTTIPMPAAAMEMSEVQIQLSRSIAGSMVEGLDYLTGFPYGCVEQTMSKALPNAVVGRALNQLGISIPTLEADLPQQISAGVQRLYAFQHDDGGWGWWFDDNSQAYQTAWVLFGLATTAEAGYEIDDGVIERGATWLKENLQRMDPRTKAFALYSLALAGHGNPEWTRTLAVNADELDTFAQASLALALYEMGYEAEAHELVELLVDTAVIGENGRVHWQGATNDGSYDRKTMASDTRNTAIALSAISRITPGHELEPGIVRWLMAMRRQSGWGTTNETAFAIIGLTDHLLAAHFSDNSSAVTYTIQINGETFATGNLDSSLPTTTIAVPRSALADQNTVVIMQNGERPLYFVINTRTYLSQGSIPQTGAINVTRTYVDPDTNKAVESLSPGDLVRVNIRVFMPEPGSYILIEDQLPGGLEALNERLNTTSHVTEQYENVQYYWERYGYNQKEVYGDRVSFFITELEAGTHTFSYYARVTQTGSFTAMPAELSAMYDFTVWGRSASDEVVIGSQ